MFLPPNDAVSHRGQPRLTFDLSVSHSLAGSG
jgi:hypothetical protein